MRAPESSLRGAYLFADWSMSSGAPMLSDSELDSSSQRSVDEEIRSRCALAAWA